MKHRPLLHLVALCTTTSAAVLLASRVRAGDCSAPPPPQQGPGQPGGILDPEERLARLTAQLGLTVEQQEQIRPLLLAQAEAAIQQAAAHRELVAALTPEQREKFASQHPGPRGKRGRHDAPLPPDAE